MGGSDYDDEWVLPSADITLVLVGKLGYGKSATGNSILGREAFVSEYSHASVTNTCQMGSTTLKDGRTINVIDTPGELYVQCYCYSIVLAFGCCKCLMPMICATCVLLPFFPSSYVVMVILCRRNMIINSIIVIEDANKYAPYRMYIYSFWTFNIPTLW